MKKHMLFCGLFVVSIIYVNAMEEEVKNLHLKNMSYVSAKLVVYEKVNDRRYKTILENCELEPEKTLDLSEHLKIGKSYQIAYTWEKENSSLSIERKKYEKYSKNHFVEVDLEKERFMSPNPYYKSKALLLLPVNIKYKSKKNINEKTIFEIELGPFTPIITKFIK